MQIVIFVFSFFLFFLYYFYFNFVGINQKYMLIRNICYLLTSIANRTDHILAVELYTHIYKYACNGLCSKLCWCLLDVSGET